LIVEKLYLVVLGFF